jgi:hypothetical protein
MRVHERLKRVSHLVFWLGEERRGGGQADARPAPEAEQPERPRWIRPPRTTGRRKAVEADLEARSHGQITGLELVDPATLIG